MTVKELTIERLILTLYVQQMLKEIKAFEEDRQNKHYTTNLYMNSPNKHRADFNRFRIFAQQQALRIEKGIKNDI